MFSFRYLTVVAVIAAMTLLCVVVYGEFVSPGASSDVSRSDQNARTIRVADRDISAVVVDTPESREKGLSGNPGLKSDEGMLFVFPEDDFHSFWMKDMRFSIDIVWLSADGVVVDIAENVSPSTYPRSFVSELPARYVLELPAGFVKTHGLKESDIVGL